MNKQAQLFTIFIIALGLESTGEVPSSVWVIATALVFFFYIKGSKHSYYGKVGVV